MDINVEETNQETTSDIFRKHTISLLTALACVCTLAFFIYLTMFVVTVIATLSGISVLGIITGLIFSGYLFSTGVIEATFMGAIAGAKSVGNWIADSIYK